ncbi:A-kinase anchor protein 13 isoform X14 [Zalophus californianus]|uniref:A-kinase anchor protein 13 isoform X14 n=1 Tax=Zalophus californianus TaxID=9704 RepID=A0A6J2B4F8_ZALCA|nr:A-kinase anchor protein 13 isoform X14 [Zalophus californianus]
MKLNPQQAPLYGDCVVTVLLAEEDKIEDDVVFYLVFSGSTLHHCTSTRKVSADTLETIAPGHDCCETVKVLLCASKEGLPIFVVAEEDFQFIQDEAYDAAQFLATSAGNQQALNFTRFLDRSGPPAGDVNTLDEKVALAFRHLKLPAEWNVLGTDQTLHDGGPRETLMHFAVRLGLLRLTWFLLQKPGGRGALSIHNQEGATPVSLALERGYHKLHQLLTEENAGEPDSWSSLSYEIPYGDCSVRHHRELDVYTLTSESESHHEAPFPGDSCTGHIFKLMNIQQQLMKTNLKQMENPVPLMVAAQDPSSLPSAQDPDGQFLGCTSDPGDGQPHSSLPEDPEHPLCGHGSTVGEMESSSYLSGVAEEENTDCSYEKGTKGVGRAGEEAEPSLAADCGTVSEPSSCLGSTPACGGEGTGDFLSCGIRNGETGTKSSALAPEQESPKPGDSVLQGDMGMQLGTAPTPHFSGGDLAVSVPVTAGETECGLLSSDTTIQKDVLEVRERTEEKFENSNISTAGVSDVKVTRQPADKAFVPNCVSAPGCPDGNKPAESLLESSKGEACPVKTAETETSGSCEGGAGPPVDQSSLVVPAAAEDTASDGLDPSAPLAGTSEAASPSALTFPGPRKDAPNQKSEPDSSPIQSCSTAGGDTLGATPARGQSTGTSGGVLAAGHCDGLSTRPESTGPGLAPTQHPPPAFCCEGPQAHTATAGPLRLDTQEQVEFCPLEVSDTKGHGKDLNLGTALTNMLEVPPQAVVPKAEKELVPARAVTSDETSLASSPGSESVTKDDALSLVPSQKEKGTATPELHTATDSRDGPGRDSSDPDKQPLEDGATGLPAPSTALRLQPSMGNTSPMGLGGEHGDPCLSAAPEALDIEGGGADSFPLRAGKATVASDSILTEQGKNLVVPELSEAQGQDGRDKAVTCSSGTFHEEQRTPPPGQEALRFFGEPSSAACAEDRALERHNSLGTPSACLNAETKHNKEVAPPVSLLTEGGAAQSLVPLGASLAADPRQEAFGAEQSSSTPLPGLLPDGSEALPGNRSSALDVGVQNPESQGQFDSYFDATTCHQVQTEGLSPCSPPGCVEMPDLKAADEVDFLSNTRASSASAEVAVGDPAATPDVKQGLATRAINRESWCAIKPCPDTASLLAPAQSPDCENFLDVGLGRECASKQGVLKRESGSDSDLFHSPSEEVDSIVFPKPEEEPLVCDITGSSSSTDDTASLDRHSSHGSDVSLPQISNLNRSRDQQCLDSFYSHGVGAEGRESEGEAAGSGEMEEEEMDSITEVPSNCSVLRSSMRSLSPFRRHSWGPGKNAASDAEMNQRSSLRVLGDVVRRPPIHRRSMSWCPSGVQYSAALSADFNYRSFSLEGLAGGAGAGNEPSSSLGVDSINTKELRHPFSGEERGDSLVSLSEEDLESGQREHRMLDQQACHRSKQQGFNYCTSAVSSPLTKSISLMTISHPGLDHSRPFLGTSANLTESITEETYSFLPQSPSKKDFEGKSGTKVSRTFSYIKNKMSSSKKSREKEKEKEKIKEKERESKEKEKDKKMVNGHTFSPIPVVGPISCSQCVKPFASKDAYTCAGCSAFVHKGCRESLASCAKVKMKQPRGSLQAQDTSSLPTVILRSKPSQPKERPRSAVLLADEATAIPMFANRRSQQSVSLSKSVSIQNIAGVGNDENISNTWKFLSHSTDSLNKISKVNESTESLTDEGVGTDMNEGQLMGDFEMESKQLEAESWSRIVDSKFLKQQKKDVVKRQEVIYELMQTELHHIRTLKIMSDVYSRGMMTELLFEQQTVEKLFPCLDELISIHSQFFQRILERKKESLVDKSEKNFLIKRMGDVLVNQFSGENAERLKKTYGKFCGQHNQSVNYFKDIYTKDKRFQAFVKKKMSSAVVRRLGIPECILLVTQRITKYPVLFQRILQCTKDNDVEQEDLAQSLSLVKDVIGAVDSKVASYEKKVRLNEIYTKTDSKSIMRMKSGQMFAKEDLKRKKLVRDGAVFLKNAAGRLKEVQAVLLTDILVFLQEKDQKYVFASLDQKSTVISLKKLIVREVAHEEKGLFLISMGMKDPEMVEVHASSKEERNSWIQIVQDTINTLNRDEDEGIPSENEEEKRMLDTKARELKEQLQQKDQQILLLLEEKEMIFRDMTECSTPLPEDCSPTHSSRILFRSNTEEALKGGPLMKSAINEVEILQGLVSGSLGGTLGQVVSSPVEQEGMVGPVSLPRRAETFGGFDSHQMNASKGGEKEEGEDGQDLRRTESDSGLKKGGNANVVFMLKRNSEQVVQSVVHLHELLSTLQGVVLQQDSYIEDQKLLLAERALARSSSRPSSLVEQEKQRSLEKQRQDLANLQRQQAQHQEEKRRREREWEARERALQEREARLAQREQDVRRGQQELERERDELQHRKGAYQCDLERLRAAQKQLEREQEQLRRDAEHLSQRQAEHDARQVSHQHTKLLRIPSFLPNPEESPLPSAPSVAKSGSLDSELSVSPKRNSLSRTHKDKGPFHILSSTSQPNKVPEGQGQTPVPASASTRLFGLAKPKDKKEKKKNKKGSRSQPGDGPASEVPAEGEEIFC